MQADGAICALQPPRVFRVYRRRNRDQLSLANFFLLFGEQLLGGNRWIKLAKLIPRDELEDVYTSQFFKRFGAPAIPFCIALGALILKQALGSGMKNSLSRSGDFQE